MEDFMQIPQGNGIRIHEVSQWYGDKSSPVLGRVSLTIQPGEFVSIVGPSGCGKSTLLRMIAGLLVPSEGSISIDSDKAVSSQQQPSRRPDVGFVFQQAALLPWRTVRDNLLLPFELGSQAGKAGAPNQQAIISVLQRVGLKETDASKRPAELSGGMRMRVSLARAILTNPQILLLDEPLAAVDDILRLQLQNDLAGLHSEKQLTSVLVTHNLHEAVFLSDRVFVMSVYRAGQSAGAQMSSEIAVTRPHPRTAEFRRTSEFFELTNKVSELLHAGGAM